MAEGADDNVDLQEIRKFEALASRWWDPASEFKPLHDINPLRLNYIDQRSPLAGRCVLDVGCGGGLLSEAMALRGAEVTGIDMGEAPLAVARLHAEQSGAQVRYLQRTAEDVAQSWTNSILESVRDGGEGKSTKGDSFLVALAKALGKVMDGKMGQMKAKTDELGGLDSKDSKYGQLTAEIQALGQEMNMVSQALNNSIKSIGEAGSTLARKG